MKKFAFLIHLRNYREDVKLLAKPLGLIPESVYRFLLKNRPIAPFIGSEVRLTPGATEPEGYIIVLPYSGKQLLEQQKEMLPLIEKATKLAASKGAEIMGLGALTSPITLGGKLVKNNPYTAITNGNAFTAVITWKKVVDLIANSQKVNPVIALVGATGSVGSLVCKLLAKHNKQAEYLLLARDQNKLQNLSGEIRAISYAEPKISVNLEDVKRADIVVLLTSASDCILRSEHLKKDAIVLDVTQPRNTCPELLSERPDVTIIDGGLVSVPHLKLQGSMGLPKGISFACFAETMLLAKAGHEGDFSIGNPTLEQAEFISELANQYSHLGFGIAPDHSFGKPVPKVISIKSGSGKQLSNVSKLLIFIYKTKNMKKIILPKLVFYRVLILLSVITFPSCGKIDLGEDFGNVGCFGCGSYNVGCFGCGSYYNTISITSNKFSPDTLIVKKGDTVKWTNWDNEIHNFLASNDPTFSASIVAYGELSYTPQKTGTLKYYCTRHSEKGILITQ